MAGGLTDRLTSMLVTREEGLHTSSEGLPPSRASDGAADREDDAVEVVVVL